MKVSLPGLQYAAAGFVNSVTGGGRRAVSEWVNVFGWGDGMKGGTHGFR